MTDSVAAPGGIATRVLRRFAAIGVVVTVIDIGLLLLLVRGFRLSPVLADPVAIGIAAGVSWFANRSITFADDPWVRWVSSPLTFVSTVLIGAGFDLLVLSAGAYLLGPESVLSLFWVKLAAVAVAAMFRALVYRAVLFKQVQDDLATRVDRGPAPGEVRLSVVVPAYGEEGRIGDTVDRLRTELSSIARNGGLEIVVVDDGSTDRTADAARAAAADQVVVQPINRGKGAAVRAGMLVARGRTIAFTDADLAYPPAQLERLLTKIEDGWDVVVGNRHHPDSDTVVEARWVREFGGRIINRFTYAVLLGHHRDTQCGIKAFRSDVARVLFSKTTVDGFAFDVEVFHLVERYRLSLTEVPVSVENSDQSTVHIVRDSTRLVRDLIRVLRAGRKGQYDLGDDDVLAAAPPAASPRPIGPSPDDN